MLDALKAASDDDKIWNYMSDETVFDPALFVNKLSKGHRVKYIYNGKSYTGLSLVGQTGKTLRQKQNTLSVLFHSF